MENSWHCIFYSIHGCNECSELSFQGMCDGGGVERHHPLLYVCVHVYVCICVGTGVGAFVFVCVCV